MMPGTHEPEDFKPTVDDEPIVEASRKPRRALVITVIAAVATLVAGAFISLTLPGKPADQTTLIETQGTIPVSVIRYSQYENGHYVVVADASNKHYYSVSDDLKNWVTGTIPGFTNGFSLSIVGKTLIALESGPSVNMAVSSDWGRTWTKSTIPQSYQVSLDMLGTVGNAILMPGLNSAGTAALVSTDEGKTWRAVPMGNDRSFAGALKLDDTRSIAVFAPGGEWNGMDLLTFTFSAAITEKDIQSLGALPLSSPSVKGTDLDAMRYSIGNGYLMVTAGDPKSGKIYTASTKDGITWKASSLPTAFRSQYDPVKGTVGDGIMTGFAADRFALIRMTDSQVAYTSADGLAWTPVNPPLDPAVRFIAQYDDGRIWASTIKTKTEGSTADGVTRFACSFDSGNSWLKADQPFSGLRAITFPMGETLLLANEAHIAYTKDCKNWTEVALNGEPFIDTTTPVDQ